MRKFALFLAACWMLTMAAYADVEPADYAFLLSAQAVASPPSFPSSWPPKSLPAIYVRRKLLGEANWGATVTLPGNATSYTDWNAEAGRAYEYEFQGIVQPDPHEIARSEEH